MQTQKQGDDQGIQPGLAWETGFVSRTSQPSSLGTTLLGCEKAELRPLTKLHAIYQ